MYKAQRKGMNRELFILSQFPWLFCYSVLRDEFGRGYIVTWLFRLKCSSSICIVHKICMRLFTVFAKSHVFQKTASKD